MARKSSRRSRIPRPWRRTRAFVVLNLLLWAALGLWFLAQPESRRAEVTQLLRNAADGRNGITAFEVAWDLWQLYAGSDFVSGVATGDRTHLYGGTPRPVRTEESLRVLVNEGYVVGYSDTLGAPRWAAYRLSDVGSREPLPRPDRFEVDLRTAARIRPDLYARSGYDRGHLAPNYAIASRHGAAAQGETFFMSNIVPQRPALNGGLWKQLEQRIATNYPARFGEIWIFAGPIFGDRPARLRRRVAIPEGFFMIIVDESEGRVRAAAFLLPQEPPSEKPLQDYLVSIDEIERLTGLDVLSDLPDSAEAALEARPIDRVW